MVNIAPPRASKTVIIMTLFPTDLREEVLNDVPIVKAIKPNAISLIHLTALSFPSSHPPIYLPNTNGPKIIPLKRYPVTFGSFSNFIKREDKSPTKRAKAIQRIWFI